MSSPDEPLGRRRALALLAAAAGLAGCNLRPLHGGAVGAKVDRELASVDVLAPRSRLGQILREELSRELNPAGLSAEPDYDLHVRLERYKDALAIQLDDTTTRYNLTIFARYELRRRADRTVVLKSASRRVASYNVVRAPYATLVAEQDAERRALSELAKEIRTRLSVAFAGNQV
jgi:LPS-assembly lipoprotein